MKEIGRRKLDKTIILGAGDELVMNYIEIDGVVRTERSTRIGTMIPYRGTLVDEAVMFEGEFEGRYVVGAMLLEAK